MYPYSLSFISQDLQEKYQEHIVRSHLDVFYKNLFIFGLMGTPIAVYALILGMKFMGLYILYYGLILTTITYLTTQKYPEYFNLLCLTFQLMLILSQPGLKIFNLIQAPVADVDNFQTGQFITIVFLSFNLGSSFLLKGASIIISIIVQCLTKFIKQEEFAPLFIVWFGYKLFMLYYVYRQDRIQKEAFLAKHNEKMWQKEVGSLSQISIMTQITDKGQPLLDFNKCNDICKKEFGIFNMDSLKKFLNQLILTPKDQFNQSVLKDMRCKTNSKKFTNIRNKLQQFSIRDQIDRQEFIGLYNTFTYDIKIFTTWDDQQLNIHTLMTLSQNQIDSENSQTQKFERALFSHYRAQFGISNKTIFIKLQKLGQKIGKQNIHESLISEIHNALRMSYNIQLFLHPIYQQCKTSFFLLPLIEQINAIAMTSIPEPFKLNIRYFISSDIKIFSCQKTIFHIIFNLFSIMTRPAKKSGNIMITAKIHSSKQNSFYINFCIATDMKSTQDLLVNQNFKMTKSGIYKGFNPHNQKVGLEMLVSEYLIGQIGPYRRIKFINYSQERQMICFSIYQDLQCLK